MAPREAKDAEDLGGAVRRGSVSCNELPPRLAETAAEEELRSAVTAAGGDVVDVCEVCRTTSLPEMIKRTHLAHRLKEWAFLVTYIFDFITCAVYDEVLKPRPGGSKRPVVLVPGWCGRTRSLRRMADRLQAEGYPVYPVPLGHQLGCIDRKAQRLSDFLDRHNLNDVYVVAHSMGGLVTVRSMMKGEARIRKVLTLGTPYHGTFVIYLGWLISMGTAYLLARILGWWAGIVYLWGFYNIPSLWQMMPSSAFLREIMTYLTHCDKVQCVYALMDQVVMHSVVSCWAPTRLGKHDDVCIPEFGHMSLFMGETGVELVARLLRSYDVRFSVVTSGEMSTSTCVSCRTGRSGHAPLSAE